ncbi:MAG TPA: PEP/pyruvate-binding domain-containing protein [Candidatus Saccharimonadia bacterium]|nr:PEP/pyruvate-binding domain-containing protein [Candidatus Saccharimonadia bacterium]
MQAAGGKGASLGEMLQAKFPVPPGFAVTTSAYRKLKNKLTPQFRDEVLAAFDALGAPYVAVRSSAIAEDSPDASWAGQFDTFLNITKDQLIDRIEACWISASTDAVRQYAENQSTRQDELAVAVVIQKMVQSEVAGVAFSVNPVTNNTNEIMIEAVYGLGELLVQGSVTPDNYLVSKTRSEIVSENIPQKTTMLTYVNGKNLEQPVPDNLAGRSCLSDSQILELAELVTTIESHYGKPQDIEWAMENSKFYIVQSRPVTTI